MQGRGKAQSKPHLVDHGAIVHLDQQRQQVGGVALQHCWVAAQVAHAQAGFALGAWTCRHRRPMSTMQGSPLDARSLSDNSMPEHLLIALAYDFHTCADPVRDSAEMSRVRAYQARRWAWRAGRA